MIKFNIIIPTRERADTLQQSLKTCVDQDYDELSIIVSDNSSEDNTCEVVKQFNDSRIKYIKTPGRLSMSSNWDFAFREVSDGYTCVLGDDDGLIPGVLSHLSEIITEHKVDAINSKDRAIYYWPEFVDEESQGVLQLSLDDTYKIVDTGKFFRQSFDQLESIYLPQLYHGFVKTEVVKKLVAGNGNIFNASSPDIYSSILLGSVIKKHIQSDYPLTIHGLSHHSIGSSYNLYKHKHPEAAEKFIKEAGVLSHPKICLGPSTAIIMADAFMQAHDHASNIPAVDIKKVIDLSLKEGSTKPFREIYDRIVESVLQTAKNNNLEEYALNCIRENPFIEPPITKKSKYTFELRNSTLTLETKSLGIKNVYDASKLIHKLLPSHPNYYFSKPLHEPILDYFSRGFRFLMKRIIQRLK